MTFPELVDQQWSDYAERHRDKTHLMLKIVAVPLVWLAAIQLFGALLLMLMPGVSGIGPLVWALVMVAVSVFLQVRGASMEADKARPFALTRDYALWLAADDFVNFPRFVLTGEWLRNLKGA
jgi:hypothetical protein